MNIWNDLDRGAVKQEEAFQQADEAVRKKSDGDGEEPVKPPAEAINDCIDQTTRSRRWTLIAMARRCGL